MAATTILVVEDDLSILRGLKDNLKFEGYDATPTTRTVDNFILDLRKKFEDDPANPKHIVSVHGVGYKFLP